MKGGKWNMTFTKMIGPISVLVGALMMLLVHWIADRSSFIVNHFNGLRFTYVVLIATGTVLYTKFS